MRRAGAHLNLNIVGGWGRDYQLTVSAGGLRVEVRVGVEAEAEVGFAFEIGVAVGLRIGLGFE